MPKNKSLSMPSMQIVETKPLNELLSETTVKVCWVSDTVPNANNTLITEKIGNEIAASLPGAPIVGFFDKSTKDFEAHSREVKIENGEFVFEELTRPYGFVSPLVSPWFEYLEDADGVSRKWLLCKAYLWTRQYQEAREIKGKGQSMELNPAAIEGYYDENDVFIFTSATLDKLCVLGDEYPPCFDGAQFLAQFSKQYYSIAEALQNTIERGYYVMNGKLQKKKSSVSLSYALDLGWNLVSLIGNQIAKRGMENYDIEETFFEEGKIYAIIKNVISGEHYKIGLIVYDDESVELEVDMTPVAKKWATIEANEGKEEVAPGSEDAPAREFSKVEDESEAAEDDKESEEAGETKKTEEVEGAADVVEQPAATEESEEAEETEKEEAPEVTKVADEEITEEVAQATEEVADEQIEFASKIETLEKENLELRAKLKEYEAKEAEQLVEDKKLLIEEYVALVEDEAHKEALRAIGSEVLDAQFTLEEAEDKLTLGYGKLIKEAAKSAVKEEAASLTYNLSSKEEKYQDMPEFLKKAKAYDEEKRLKLSL